MKTVVYKGVLVSMFALALASCATEAPPPPPPPPPAPAGPPVALSPVVSDAASVYLEYVKTAREMTPDFATAEVIQTKLQQGAAYEPKQLARGAVAYAAIVAMQEPSFRSELRAYAANPESRAQLINNIMSNPAAAANIPGANIAARRVILALSSHGESVYKAGARVKQAAYDIQKQHWSREFIKTRDVRLSQAKINSTTAHPVAADQSNQLLVAALTGQGMVTQATSAAYSTDQAATIAATSTGQHDPIVAQKLTAQDLQPGVTLPANMFDAPYTATVNRGLAIAALAILGEGAGANEANISMLLDERDGPTCLSMAKLNLYQCLAVAKPHFEDVFCIGQHILMDTGQCIGQVSSNALDLAPKRTVEFNADGTEKLKYVNAKPYIKPAPAKKAPAKKTATKKKTS
ncbi:hypothetical protein Q1W73_14615 [Asticcacaulis sp. ZE23SCel15]|uniref:hypothetical protein n=1 Tax=Asticcacaulis sp. ZE23SCel15 TaxID=3059027 RepID=UPI00265F6745|nr:hypothetical protein [Asticcacaulis sp. ZE23SCel15]WKL56884.1 hypothetical protein Q1W73_14615 [Asticcacaulis sp. ZE23SCel15]